MNNNVVCPYCGKMNKLTTNPVLIPDENRLWRHKCEHCSKKFVYDMHIYIEHTAFKAPCLNGGDHCWELIFNNKLQSKRYRCKICGGKKDMYFHGGGI